MIGKNNKGWFKVTPLKSKVPLRGNSQLKSNGTLSPSGGIKKQSAGNKNRLEKYLPLRDEHLKLYPNCEICGCNEVEIHHKAFRRGDNLFKHFMSVCREHHIWIHNNIKEAIELGYIYVKGKDKNI